MSRLNWLIPGLVTLALTAACGPVEVRIGEAEGAKPMNGALVAAVDTTPSSTFQCGNTITAQDTVQTYTVTTRVVTGGCEFTFDQDVEVIAKGDYDVIKDFRSAVHFVNRVEVAVRKLDFLDDNGAKMELDTHIRDLELWVNDEQILNMEQVRAVPRTVVLAGPALALIKQAVKNRVACTLHVKARVVLLDTATRSGVRCEYASQPTYIMSTSEL